jgi:hypothetical protein
MSKDHIVEEVRAIRDSIAREHDYDLDSIFGMLQAAAAESGRAHVSPPPPPAEVIGQAAQLRFEHDGHPTRKG